MLEAAHLPDQLLIDCLRRDHEIPVSIVEFLPIGADVNTAVYKAIAGGNRLLPQATQRRFQRPDGRSCRICLRLKGSAISSRRSRPRTAGVGPGSIASP